MRFVLDSLWNFVPVGRLWSFVSYGDSEWKKCPALSDLGRVRLATMLLCTCVKAERYEGATRGHGLVLSYARAEWVVLPPRRDLCIRAQSTLSELSHWLMDGMTSL